ncbi:MAG: ABC transporter ATP-binding protein [Terrimicrobiaceae bacterium]|jgi:predicted ABC-type transport system involved in lysophospholipase L1 biosynthesis ATPase subunit
MTPRLAARGLQRSFRIGGSKIQVLRGIDLDIAPGESVFLCGASGAGKTTLLYTLAGLERPEAGTVAFEGQSLYALSGNALARLRNQRMGFVFQSYFLLPELTALENVLLPSLIKGKTNATLGRDLLDRVGLAQRMDHLPAELSGGEQQRVAIARSLINDPAVLFADEPTGNLDSKNGEIIITLLLDLAKAGGRTLVLVTHDDHLAHRGDRLIQIVDGCLAAD